MSRKNILLFAILILTLLPYNLKAQEEGTAQQGGISVFFEKVYLHTDRDYYASGNDIWFKAYLVNGQSNYLTNTSNNLYVELISPAAELLERHVVRLENGTGKGDFTLGDSIPAGTYRLRAYTSWMRNFNDHFVFEKELKVISLLDIPSADQQTAGVENKIRFFPEGGALLGGVAGRLAFKAENAEGRGVEVEGVVISSEGDTVSMFESTHLGMGMITIFPMAGTRYHVKGKFNGKEPFTAEFPAVVENGFSLQVMDTGPNELMLIVRCDPATFSEYQSKVITIAGRHAGKVYFSGDVQLTGAQTTLKLTKDYFPAGIASITLYDAEKRAQCERLIYLEGQESEKITLRFATNKSQYEARERVVLKLAARDQKKETVNAKLSLSVVDAGLVPEGISDIRTYLMLESEIKGKIEDPKQYFNPANEERVRQLELLLLTQGWRGFVWRKLQEEGVSIKYLPEPGITLSGRVRKLQNDKPLEGVNISLVASGAKGGSLYSTQTSAEGNFFLDGLEFYGKQPITLTARDKKGKKEGWILMNRLFRDTLKIDHLSAFTQGHPLASLGRLKEEEDKRVKANRAFRLSSEDFLLDEVEIRAEREKERVQMVKHNTTLAVNVSGDVSELGMQAYDFKVSEEDGDYINVGLFLEQKFPGSERVEGDVYLRVRGRTVMPKFYLDGSTMEETGNPYPIHISSMSMLEIDRIIVSGSHVSIFRRENPLPPKEFSRIDQVVEGYYEAREFYTPQYNGNSEASIKPDFRTTIHWEPDIEIDDNGEGEVIFYNTDRKGKVRIILEGISDKGFPLLGEGTFEVK